MNLSKTGTAVRQGLSAILLLFSFQSEAAVIKISPGAMHPIPPYYFGATMAQSIEKPELWSNPSFNALIKSMKLSILRYPGGTEANYWDWQKGHFVKHFTTLASPDMRHYFEMPPATLGLEELQKAIDATQATPLFVLNVVTATLDNQLSMLRAAQSKHIPVKFVELGNELYWNFPYLLKRYPSAAAYADAATQWGKVLHQQIPNILVAAVACDIPSKKNRVSSWNKGLASLKNVDALAMHTYIHLYPNIPMEQLKNPKPKTVLLTLALPFQAANKLKQDLAARPNSLSSLPIWITEYAVWAQTKGEKNTNVLKHTWALSLANAALTLLLMQNPEVAMLVTIHTSGEVAQNNLILLKNGPKLSTSGNIAFMLSNALSGTTAIRSLIFDAAKKIHINNLTYPSFLGVAFEGPQKNKMLMIVHLGNQPQTVTVQKLLGMYCSYLQMSADPLSPAARMEQKKGSTRNGLLLLAPYSVTFIQHESPPSIP